MVVVLPWPSPMNTACLPPHGTASRQLRYCRASTSCSNTDQALLHTGSRGSRCVIHGACRQPTLRAASHSTGTPVVGGRSAELLAAISSLRREGGGPEARNRVIHCVEALEAEGVIDAPVSGRWTLVYSTQQASREQQTEWDRKSIQAATNKLYKLFFRFAPALAGSQATGGAKDVRNEQIVDLEAGEVDNIVEVRLPWNKDTSLRVRVWGEVEVDDGVPTGNSLAVTFVGWSFAIVGPGQQEANELKLPLPRPRGTLSVTYCDESLRISRGGRGGIFVTSRAPDPKEPTA